MAEKKEGFGMKHFQDIQVIIDPEVAGIDFEVRRPYFRMRGKPVTEEQAFELIRRTDSFFRHDMDQYKIKNLVGGSFMLSNVWVSPHFYPHSGWIRPNGIVGQNGVTGKYPEEEEFLYSVLELKEAFPYLDFMVAITDWNECPKYVWDIEDRDEFYCALSREKYPDFPDSIVYGVWLHDDKVELTAPTRAREKYLEYNSLYGAKDEAIFTMDYYEENKIHPVDFAYLQRCIRSHGLEPDEVLAKYEWTSEGLKYKRGGLEVEAISGGGADG